MYLRLCYHTQSICTLLYCTMYMIAQYILPIVKQKITQNVNIVCYFITVVQEDVSFHS